jgi:peptidoglycan/xylan/chitin deacetylase (PgdA/CDA1 family)
MAENDPLDPQQPDMTRAARRSASASKRQGTGYGWLGMWLGIAALVVVVVVAGVFVARAVLGKPAGGTAPSSSASSASNDAASSTTASAAVVATTGVTTAPAKSSADATANAAPVPVADPATDQAVTVLMYHHVMPVPSNSIAITPSTFDSQMKYLQDHGFHPVSITQMDDFVNTGKRLPEKPVLITFDDGRTNQLTYAVPILKKYGFTATFFVVKKWVVTTSQFFMHDAELKQLAADGFDVQSHTTNHIQIHPSKTKSGGMETYAKFKKRYWEPTNGMITWMATELGGPPVIAVAYPGGRFNPQAEQLAQEAGYHLAFTTNDGYVTYKGQSAFALPRWNTGARGTTAATFAAVVNGAARAAKKSKK